MLSYGAARNGKHKDARESKERGRGMLGHAVKRCKTSQTMEIVFALRMG